MDLTSTFSYSGWRIKYNLSDPPKTHATSSKPAVVFVHGTPWSSAVFKPIAKLLLFRGHQVLLYDLSGYGESQDLKAGNNDLQTESTFAGDTSVASQAAVLSALLSHLQLNRFRPDPVVIAHDIAGAIALRAHLIHNCEFSSLLLLDTNAVLPWGDGFYKLVRSQPEAFLNLPPSIFEAVVRAVIRSACFNPKKLDAGWEDALTAPWIAGEMNKSQQSFVRQIAQANDADVAEMLDQNLYEKVRCKVKIVWGENDQWIPKNKMEKLAELLKHCLRGFVVVPEAGHLVMIDQPEVVTAEILGWVEES